ncbi:MAG: lipid-binding SYLF domain-containing protein [Methanocella sp.]
MRRNWFRFLLVSSVTLVLAVTGLGVSVSAAGPAARLAEAADVLKEMGEKSDVTAMAGLVKEARGIVIFPSVIKAGLMLGGRYGEGLLLRHGPGAGEWHGPYFVQVKGVSYGPQIGVQSQALVLVITNERGMKGFTGDKVTLGGELAVAAGPVGRQAGAATDADLKAAIYSYSLSKGIFAGASLEGAVIQSDEAANKEYWGAALTADQMLAKPAHDSRTASLLKELEKLLKQAK